MSYFDKRYFIFVLVCIPSFAAFSMIQQTIGYYVQDQIHLNSSETARAIGLSMMSSASTTFLAQTLLVRYFKWSAFSFVQVGLFIMLIAFLGLTAFPHHLYLLILFMGVMGLGLGMIGPGVNGGATCAVQPEEQGKVAGLISTCPVIGFVIGPLLGTSLYHFNAFYPFIFSVFILTPISIYLWVKRHSFLTPS